MTRVYLGTTFDLIHAGHLYALRQCRELAGPDGEVVIGLNRDEFVERFKGHTTVQKLEERIEVVSALRFVDRVVVNVGDEDSKPVLEAVMPDVIAVGPDWSGDGWERYCRQMSFTLEWLAERNIRLHALRPLPGRSSTAIRQMVPATHSDVGPLTKRLAGAA